MSDSERKTSLFVFIALVCFIGVLWLNSVDCKQHPKNSEIYDQCISLVEDSLK